MQIKYCSKCGIALSEDRKHFWCIPCNRNNQRAYRQTEKGKQVRRDNIRKRRANNAEERLKHVVQEMTRTRLKKMDLSNKKCEMCGGRYEEFHHNVYDKDDLLNGKFLCIECHRRVHGGKI